MKMKRILVKIIPKSENEMAGIAGAKKLKIRTHFCS